MLGTNSMNRAPNSAPPSEASPPKTMPTRKGKPEALGRHETDRERAQAPGYAGIERADPEAGRLVERSVDPHRLGGDRLIANGDQRPPNTPPHEVARSPIERRGACEANEIQPLVGGERNPEGHARLREGQALRAPSQRVEAFVAQDLRGCDGEREGGKRKIKAAEPERGKAEQKAGDKAHDAGKRDRRPVGKAELHHQDRRAIAADGEKRAVAERDLAVEAGQEIEAEQRDREDEHLRALIDVVA